MPETASSNPIHGSQTETKVYLSNSGIFSKIKLHGAKSYQRLLLGISVLVLIGLGVVAAYNFGNRADRDQIIVAAVSTDAQKSSNHLYSISVDGKVVSALTSGVNDQVYNPDYNSSKQWLTYYQNTGKDSQIMLMDLKTKEPKAVTTGAGLKVNPKVSPDGLWIAYQLRKSPNVSLIHLLNINSGKDIELPYSGVNYLLAWYPDSSKFLFVSQQSSGSQLLFSDLVGKSTDSKIPLIVTEAAWSPDGQKLALILASDSQIYLADRDGKSPKQLTKQSGKFSFIAWSPDNDRLASVYQQDPKGKDTLQVINTKGNPVTIAVPRDLSSYNSPTWYRP